MVLYFGRFKRCIRSAKSYLLRLCKELTIFTKFREKYQKKCRFLINKNFYCTKKLNSISSKCKQLFRKIWSNTGKFHPYIKKIPTTDNKKYSLPSLLLKVVPSNKNFPKFRFTPSFEKILTFFDVFCFPRIFLKFRCLLIFFMKNRKFELFLFIAELILTICS